MKHEIEKLAFEAAMGQLEEVVRLLEAGQNTLEDSISLYEKGTLLKRHCEKKLQEASLKIEKVTLDASGTVLGTEDITPLSSPEI